MDTYHPHLTALDNLPEIKNTIKILQTTIHVPPHMLNSLITHTTVYTLQCVCKSNRGISHFNINLIKIICPREQSREEQ